MVWPSGYVREWIEEDQFDFVVYYSAFAFIVGYWVPNIFLYFVYKYDLLKEYKIQHDMKYWPSQKMINETIIHNLINIPAHSVAFYLFPLHIIHHIPSFYEVFIYFVVSFLFADFSFYWLHRLFHYKHLYARFHKKHHQYRHTIGLTASYASFPEELFVNFFSTMLGPLVLSYFKQQNAICLVVYLIIRYSESVEEHCGYEIPFSPWKFLRDNGHHDYHHR